LRKAHYLRPIHGNESPSEAIWVDTETDAVNINETEERHVLREGMACYRRRYAPGQWSKGKWCEFTNIETFWDFVVSRLRKKIKLYVFAHNWSFDGPVLDLFNRLPDMGWKLESSVIESPPVILKWRKDKMTICVIDTLNIWRIPLAKLGDSIGLPKLEMPDKEGTQEEWKAYNRRDVEIIMEACINWWNFLIRYDLGGFAPTIAAQAFRTYRHKFMHDKLLIDTHTEALELARSGIFGGRTECFELGRIKDKVYKLDINSMYPFIMKFFHMPTQLAHYGEKLSKNKLREHLKNYCVTARVELVTNENAYPKIFDNKLIFPTGHFTTTLNSPELLYALDNNHIKSIKEFALYFRSRIFTDYIDFFYSLRLKAKEANDDVLGDQCKLFLNSLWGKFSQRGRYYEKIGVDDNRRVAVWQEVDAATGDLASFRSYAGIIECLHTGAESRYSHPSIGGHVTSNARMMLWDAIKRAGVDNIYYCDTDSIWCNKQGYDNLFDYIHQKELGFFKLEGKSTDVTIRGLKDYEFGDEVRIKGVKKKARKVDENVYEQAQFSSLKANVRKGDLTAPIVRTVTKQLRREYTKGLVLRNGRVLPFTYVSGELSRG